MQLINASDSRSKSLDPLAGSPAGRAKSTIVASVAATTITATTRLAATLSTTTAAATTTTIAIAASATFSLTVLTIATAAAAAGTAVVTPAFARSRREQAQLVDVAADNSRRRLKARLKLPLQAAQAGRVHAAGHPRGAGEDAQPKRQRHVDAAGEDSRVERCAQWYEHAAAQLLGQCQQLVQLVAACEQARQVEQRRGTREERLGGASNATEQAVLVAVDMRRDEGVARRHASGRRQQDD